MAAGILRGLAWAGIILGILGALLARSSVAWVPFAVMACASLTWLIVAAGRDRRRASRLPPQLIRLAYRSDETVVAFCWKWRDRRHGRLRIVRSTSEGATQPDAGAPGQTVVYDGSDDTFADPGIAPRTTYHYSLFAESDSGRWSEPVLVMVTTLSPNDQAAIEATYDSHDWSEDAEDRPVRRNALGETIQPVPDPWTDPDVRLAHASVADAVSGPAADLVLSVAPVFVRDGTADGWVEVE